MAVCPHSHWMCTVPTVPPPGGPRSSLSLPDWPLAGPWSCWETLGPDSHRAQDTSPPLKGSLEPCRSRVPRGSTRLGLGMGPVPSPGPDSGTDTPRTPPASSASLVSVLPYLAHPLPAPCPIALTISTLFVSSDSCCTHLCCPAVSPPVDCACGELPLRAFTNCPSAPGASIRLLHMAPSSTAASTVTTACVAPFCLSPHPDCPSSPRAPAGPCKCPSRTEWRGRTLWECRAGCPRLREARPSRAGWGEAGATWARQLCALSPEMLKFSQRACYATTGVCLTRQGTAGAGREVVVCGHRWWPVQTGRP